MLTYGDAQRLSIGAKFCTYARLGATYKSIDWSHGVARAIQCKHTPIVFAHS